MLGEKIEESNALAAAPEVTISPASWPRSNVDLRARIVVFAPYGMARKPSGGTRLTSGDSNAFCRSSPSSRIMVANSDWFPTVIPNIGSDKRNTKPAIPEGIGFGVELVVELALGTRGIERHRRGAADPKPDPTAESCC